MTCFLTGDLNSLPKKELPRSLQFSRGAVPGELATSTGRLPAVEPVGLSIDVNPSSPFTHIGTDIDVQIEIEI